MQDSGWRKGLFVGYIDGGRQKLPLLGLSVHYCYLYRDLYSLIWFERQWLVQTFHLFDGELQFVDEMLALDVRNNSAWNHRYFVISRTKNSDEFVVQKEEMTFAMTKLKRIGDNESGWNYLRGYCLLCSVWRTED